MDICIIEKRRISDGIITWSRLVPRPRSWEEKKFSRGSLPSATIPSNGSKDRISIRSVSRKKEKVGSADRARSRAARFSFSFSFLFLNGGHGSLRPNYTCRSGSGDQKLRQEVKGRECIVKLPLSKHSPRSQVTANTHDISIRLSLFFSSLLPRFQPRSLPPPRFRSLCWKYPQVILKNGPSVSAAMGSNATHGFHPRTTHPHLRKRTAGHTREIYSNFLRFSPRRSSIRGIRSRFE